MTSIEPVPVPDGPISPRVPPDAIQDVPAGALNGARLADLRRRADRNQERAFTQFYDATSTQAYGLAVRVVRNPADAEQVVRDAYLEIWRAVNRFDPLQGSALSWLLTHVHRRAADQVRGASRTLTPIQLRPGESCFSRP